MGRYIVKRLGIGIISLFVLVTVTFFLTRLMPGSPFQSGAVSEQIVAALEEQYGLSEPLPVQYGTYLRNLLKGDLGISYQKPGVTVSDVISRAWPITAGIGLPAIVIALFLGTLMGIWQATTKHTAVRSGIFIGTVLGTAIPNFVIALVLMFLFGQTLKLFPIVGLTSPAHYVLPVISLSIYPTAVVTRMMKNAFSEEMDKEYVIMAKAKGLTKHQVTVSHILKNAWIPVLNYIGPAAAFLITGSFVIENIFTIPGLGREFVLSISNRDYTMIMGLTIFMGMVVIVINLLTDLLCAVISPQIRRSSRI